MNTAIIAPSEADRKPSVLRIPFCSEYGEDYVVMQLERYCPACPRGEAEADCPSCDGKGLVLTSAGRSILALVARHGVPA